MDCYNSKNEEIKNEICRAFIKFLISLTSLMPILIVAMGAAVFINQLFAPPFGFMCKSVPAEIARPKHKVEPLRVIPLGELKKENAISHQIAEPRSDEDKDK